MSHAFTRRSALALLGAAALGPGCASTGGGSPSAAVYTKFRAVRFDTSALVLDPKSTALLVSSMQNWLPRYFGPHLAPGDAGAPVLVIKPLTIELGIGGSAGGPYSSGTMDYATAEGDVIGAGGRTVATYPLTVALFAYDQQDDVTGNSYRVRVANLGQGIVQFMPGKLGF